MIECILAVDAGGTKTKIALIDFNKNIVFEKIGGPGSPAVAGVKAIEYIFGLVREVCFDKKNEYNIRYIQMGISGLGTISNKRDFEESLSQELSIPVSLENDAILALFSIVEDKYDEGLLVLAGTGSACYGVSGLDTFLIGGWGHLLSEYGSSYAAVRDLVLRTIDIYESGNDLPNLSVRFMKEINIKNVNEFKVFMYNNKKADIASFAKFISNEALSGDEMAKDILINSGKSLANGIGLIYQRLGLSSNAVIGFRGSFVEKAPFVKNSFFKELQLLGYSPLEVNGYDDPVYGAYFMAKRKLDIC